MLSKIKYGLLVLSAGALLIFSWLYFCLLHQDSIVKTNHFIGVQKFAFANFLQVEIHSQKEITYTLKDYIGNGWARPYTELSFVINGTKFFITDKIATLGLKVNGQIYNETIDQMLIINEQGNISVIKDPSGPHGIIPIPK